MFAFLKRYIRRPSTIVKKPLSCEISVITDSFDGQRVVEIKHIRAASVRLLRESLISRCSRIADPLLVIEYDGDILYTPEAASTIIAKLNTCRDVPILRPGHYTTIRYWLRHDDPLWGRVSPI